MRLPGALDPAAVRAVAMDLDRTILGPSLEFTDALVEAVAAVEAAGIVPVIATGRMFRSARRYAQRLGLTAPLICYQGALVADPNTGEWLLHEPLARPTARELIEADPAARVPHQRLRRRRALRGRAEREAPTSMRATPGWRRTQSATSRPG